MSETVISAYTLGFEWPTALWGASGTARFWVSKDFSDVDGRRYLGANAGTTGAMLRSADITVVDHAATIDGVSLPKTTNAQSGGPAQVTCWIYDSRGQKVEEFFLGRINHELLDATNWPAIFLDNAARRRPLGDTYPTVSQVIALIQAIVYALASFVEYGLVRLDTAPDDSADPVTVGVNSLLLGSAWGAATLDGGEVEVEADEVTADSLIFLSAQDDQTIGTLRVSARTPGAGFTITSSDGADRGLVAWEIKEPR